ncbi:hypothetical protein EYF80_005479 [Liparis tanakae]|uniref:Uncharacterized protein n=1 Tax=Liparis tanakae TaxID=230148 RepID=A0A4Z2J3W5_9TELE|nr:hypothetical protein EYF80_005479 [Liparis tanakae]
MLNPTLTMVLDRKTVNTTTEEISRLRKALKRELQTGDTGREKEDNNWDKSCRLWLFPSSAHCRARRRRSNMRFKREASGARSGGPAPPGETIFIIWRMTNCPDDNFL